MAADFYIPRSLTCQDENLTDVDLLRDEGVVVLLAEPGAGKTDLLGNVAQRIGVQRQIASIFRARTTLMRVDTLVLDALDEVARLDESGLWAVLVKAQETQARRVILASRSSEWDESQSVFVRECFRTEPRVAHLRPFRDAEQEQLFLHHKPDEDFAGFRSELSRFGLDSLFGNPMFLLLFADAYVESGRKFTTKEQIFDAAVRSLAFEANISLPQKNRPPVEAIIDCASEVFAKLLLSGAAGVSTRDNPQERHFPRFSSLVSENYGQVSYVLDTRLLKPSTDQGQHEPVHRMVAEYCAARYLVNRINENRDSLTLRRCLAIIAPSSVVRDELRGLLGWMAALGSRAVQQGAIALDPYAVLANGDPSRLLSTSIRYLLTELKKAAKQDPYFRRGNMGHSFSLSGFFRHEVVEEIRPLLTTYGDQGHLGNLLLEMLKGSKALQTLTPELSKLMLDGHNSLTTRLLAHRDLADVAEHDHKSDCEALIKECTHDAMRISVEMFQNLGVAVLGRDTLLALLRMYAGLYSKRQRGSHVSLGYHVKCLLKELDLDYVVWLLDRLTEGLACTCGSDKSHNCTCRNGVSKVVGSLLDRYFEECEGPFDAVRICQWIRNLKFERQVSRRESKAVRALQTQTELRQSMQRHLMQGITDPDEVWRVWREAFGSQSHAGLSFRAEDCWALVDHAFDSDNPVLWARFPKFRQTQDKHGPDALGTHMRCQANQKQEFMRIWAKQNREAKSFTKEFRKSDFPHRRRMRRQKRQQDQRKFENLQYLTENRALIESGHHWGSLHSFAECYLMAPEKLAEEFDDPQVVENALCNCLPFIEPELPTLQRLAELQCESRFLNVETVLHAACLAIFRRFGSLAEVKVGALAILKTGFDVSYTEIDEDTRIRFEAEVDSRLFQKASDAERFAREYLEPQVRNSRCKHTQLWWLGSKPEFSSLVATLPLEWLRRFPGATMEALETLFQLAVEHCNESIVLQVVRFHMRYIDNSFFWPDGTENEDLKARRSFWLLRSFFFEKDWPQAVEEWLKSDPDTIFAVESRISEMYRFGNKGWPDLSAQKVFLILDAFVELWPKVHLPKVYGTDSPKEETAYRFLADVVRAIEKDDPCDGLPILNLIIADGRLRDFHDVARNMRASTLRKMALRDFEAPTPSEVVKFLDRKQVITVEDLRERLIELLEELQDKIDGGEFNSVEKFYSGNGRVDEEAASDRIAEDLQVALQPFNITVNREHHLKDARRCDITVTCMFDGRRSLLVMEVKGQWHRDLYLAAKEQLHRRYAIHPDAEQQGIYLVLWFGAGEKVAGRRCHSNRSSSQLREKVVSKMPEELHSLIDVFVLDLSHKS